MTFIWQKQPATNMILRFSAFLDKFINNQEQHLIIIYTNTTHIWKYASSFTDLKKKIERPSLFCFSNVSLLVLILDNFVFIWIRSECIVDSEIWLSSCYSKRTEWLCCRSLVVSVIDQGERRTKCKTLILCLSKGQNVRGAVSLSP